MIQLLIIYFFPGLVMGNNIWGGEKPDVFLRRQLHLFLITHVIFQKYTEAVFREYRMVRKRRGFAWHDAKSDFFQGNFASDGKTDRTSDV